MMIIAIASGKGGTGKTLVSTSLFHILQELDYQVTLVDCDAEEPNDLIFFKGILSDTLDVSQQIPVIDQSKCTFCQRCHEYCNYNAIFILPSAKIIKVIEELCHDCGACYFACNDDAISQKSISLGEVRTYNLGATSYLVEARMKVGVYSPVPLIKAAIKKASDKGIVLLDAPPGTSCPFIQTVAVADYVILVTEPTPFGLSDLKQSVETLKKMNKKYGVVINRSGIGDLSVYNYLMKENIPLLAEIPFDKKIAMHYSKGEIAVQNLMELNPLFHKILTSVLHIKEITFK